MPTIQSASERDRAAGLQRGEARRRARRFSNAALIAAFVIDDSHRRWTGFFDPAFSYR